MDSSLEELAEAVVVVKVVAKIVKIPDLRLGRPVQESRPICFVEEPQNPEK